MACERSRIPTEVAFLLAMAVLSNTGTRTILGQTDRPRRASAAKGAWWNGRHGGLKIRNGSSKSCRVMTNRQLRCAEPSIWAHPGSLNQAEL